MILSKLKERLLLKATTAQTPSSMKKLEAHLSTTRTFYLGIDPTASFLHLGHFMQMMAAKFMTMDKHRGIIVIGDFTGLIGDPSGKRKERQQLSQSAVEENANSLCAIIKNIDMNSDRLLQTNSSFSIQKNSTWSNMPILDFFRLGKQFSLSTMLSRDCVSSRTDKGISYTEFSYMIFQANDFLYLKKNFDCTIQLGGSDQFGNILTGINLIHSSQESTESVYGITLNLLTDENGNKIGKSMITENIRGKAVISENHNDAVFLYNFIQTLPDAIIPEMILKLSNLSPDKTSKDLANFVIDCCWSPFSEQVSVYISSLLNALYYPESMSRDEIVQLSKNSKLFSSFIVNLSDGDMSSTDLLSREFCVPKNEIKKAIKNGNSIKMFDVDQRKWNCLRARESAMSSIPQTCIIQYGAHIPLLLIQN